ncbi:ATP-binding protein [Kitasatospora terrestris]|uniref:ATP-binding protein n=1 Tax=Kitasatospora terrestris TaxID=258051 RepID=A0ABP9EP74_9ACTN
MRPLPVEPAFHRRLAFPARSAPDVSAGIDFTRGTLRAWHPGADPAAIADIVLVAAELLANAAEHAGGPLALELCRTPVNRIRIEVTDATPARPRVQSLSPDTPHGHGLRIIDRLAHAWGCHPGDGGKTVWAECDLPPPATHAP